MKERVFPKNEVIFREGEEGTCFYQITEGTAGIYLHYGEADQRKLTEMKPGQYFGEMAIIEAWPRSATVVAEKELRAIELTGKDLIAYFNEQPERILALMNQLGDRLRQLTAEYEEVSAFIREKQNSGVEKKEGFLARLRKYKEISFLGNKYDLISNTAEERIRMENAGKDAGDVLAERIYNKGQVIFREGDDGVYMYQIHSGAVGIYAKYGTKEEEKLAKLYTNEFFGEMGMIAQEKRSATAVVEENDTVLECIRAEDLQALFQANPLKVDMILEHLSNRLRKLTIEYAKACAIAAGDA